MPDRAPIERHAVEAAARRYLGWRWAHLARGPKAVDCIGLVIMVARDLGLVAPDFDVTGYGRQTTREQMLQMFRAHMPEISPLQATRGDVVLLRDKILPTHCGIVSEKRGRPHLIHAYARVSIRRVIEEPLDLWPRPTHAFPCPGVGGE